MSPSQRGRKDKTNEHSPHTGREITADGWTVLIYSCVTSGALLRLGAGFVPAFLLPLLAAGGLVWSLAFLVFAMRYGPMLARPRI